MKKLLVGLAVGFCLLGIVGTARADLISNGSFESGAFIGAGSDDSLSLVVGSPSITGWTVISSTLGWIDDINNAWGLTASADDKYLDFTDISNTAPFGGVEQQITTTVGISYLLTFDLGSDIDWGAAADSTLLVSVAGGAGTSFNNVSDEDNRWESKSILFTASTSSTMISFTGVTGPTSYIGLDNVSVTSVPEPSLGLLLGISIIGIVGAGAVRKIKQKALVKVKS